MRLLTWNDDNEVSFTGDLVENIPSYAILSHTWGPDDQEVTFADIQNGRGQYKAGYRKINFCREQAKKDGLKYIWVDTCCIDKTNHVELQEAITSMFRWYKEATVCYVYLIDVEQRPKNEDQESSDSQLLRSWKPAFRRSRWFTRGWTLQELIAPDDVVFFSKEGERLGSKNTLEELIHEVTTIPIDVLRGRLLSQIPVAERMRWTKGRNTKKKEDQAYCLLGIFRVFMPLIYGEGENAFVRLTKEIDGVKSDLLPERTREVTSSDSIEHMTLQDRRAAFLKSLTFEQMGARHSNVKKAYALTCQWFLKHPAYLKWVDARQLHQHHGFLWINGKPGTGKSTLMKFMHTHAVKSKPRDDIVVAFFFNARGEALEKSALGMYRALLSDLLRNTAYFKDVLNEFLLAPEHQAGLSVLTIGSLQSLFQAVIMRLKQRRLTIFIDAIDECDEEHVREMVDFFEDMGVNALENGSELYTCFASRHYPTVDIRNGQKVTLETEASHTEDIAKYVEGHLRAGNGEYVNEIKLRINEKSNGVFMWAVLVIDILNEEFRRGRVFAVTKRLEEIPPKLSDLFRDILRKDCENMDDLLLCLQWILFAKRPLKRKEFYFAMVAGLDSSSENLSERSTDRVTLEDIERFILNSSKGLAELTRSGTPTVQFIHESVRDFLLKDNGLSELWPKLAEDVYSLSHDRLKDCCQNYLSIDISAYIPKNELIGEASPDSARKIRQELTSSFPFLDYASLHVLHHANEAAEGISQDKFLANFPLLSWVDLSNLLESTSPLKSACIRHHTQNVSLLYVLAEYNCSRLIPTIYRSSDLGCQGGWYHFPLIAALANGHRDVVRALLQYEDESWTEYMIAHLEFGRTLWQIGSETPLFWAIRNGYHASAEVLLVLMASRSAPDFWNLVAQDTDPGISTVLQWAISRSNERAMRVLLDKGADIEYKFGEGETALQRAVEFATENTVKLLLDRGADIEVRFHTGDTPLHRALVRGNQEIMELLLDAKANTEARDRLGRTALYLAVQSNNVELVQLLLDRGADIETTDHERRTPLACAAEFGNLQTIQLLLAHNADVTVKDELGRTPLFCFMARMEADTSLGFCEHQSQSAWPSSILKPEQEIERELSLSKSDMFDTRTACVEIVQLMLTKFENLDTPIECRGSLLLVATKLEAVELVKRLLRDAVDIEIRGPEGRAALLYATERDNETIVQILLGKQADIEAKDMYGMTPLILAASMGRLALVQLLLDNNADIEAQDCCQKTALLWAIEKGHETIVQLLIAKHANIEAKNRSGMTPLVLAASMGSLTLVQLLLDNNADIEAQDDRKEKALLWAIEKGHETIIQLLLAKHANIEAKNRFGTPPLVLAASMGSLALVQLLLDNNANTEAEDNFGRTALWHAIFDRRSDIVQLLLERKAVFNHRWMRYPRIRSMPIRVKSILADYGIVIPRKVPPIDNYDFKSDEEALVDYIPPDDQHSQTD